MAQICTLDKHRCIFIAVNENILLKLQSNGGGGGMEMMGMVVM